MKNYKRLIWTNHALERLRQRGISQGDAWATWNRADQTRKGSVLGSWVYYRTFGNNRIEVVAKKNEKGEWLILSVWSKKVFGNKIQSQKSIFRLIWDSLFG